MSDLIVFALIGLLVGASSRLLYPGREPAKVLGTLLLAMIGSMLGGVIAWGMWPGVEGQFYAGTLLTSLLGAVVVVAAWACIAYGRRIGRA
jgi:uncharacterized membrane protein YeaQ/YmgE (transglycosylase-associated protein family)